MLLPDWQASALNSALSALKAEHEQNPIVHYSPLSLSGGLCWLWLWEQAPCSHSFSDRLYDSCSPAMTGFYLHLRKNWNKLFLEMLQHCSGHLCSAVVWLCSSIQILSQCIIFKYVQVFFGRTVKRLFTDVTVLHNNIHWVFCLYYSFQN